MTEREKAGNAAGRTRASAPAAPAPAVSLETEQEYIFGFSPPTDVEIEAMKREAEEAANAGNCKTCGLPLDSFSHHKLAAKRQGAHATDKDAPEPRGRN